MKRFIFLAVAWMLLSGTAVAGTEVRGIGDTNGKNKTNLFVRPFCKFGLQFLAVTVDSDVGGGSEDNVEVLQVMAEGNYGEKPPQPMKCREDAREPVVRYK